MFANCPLKKFSIISSVPEEKSFDSKTENYYENNNNTNQIFSQGINKVKTMNWYLSLYLIKICILYMISRIKIIRIILNQVQNIIRMIL